MIQVALCLLQGAGTKKNPQEARQWLSKAAATGSREAITLYAEYFGEEKKKN
jgi:TPR repeat protein